MSKAHAVGTKFMIGDTVVGGLKTINGIDVTADTIDVTDLSNTTGYREKMTGFKGVGDVSLGGFLDGDDAGQAKCLELLNSGEAAECKIIFPPKIGKTWSFTAYVSKFTTGAEVEDAVTFESALAVSGKPTLAASAT